MSVHPAMTMYITEIKLKYHGVKWHRRVREVVGRLAYGGPDFGIHIYYLDRDGNDVAYYTPASESMMIFDTPRKRGDHIELIDY
jgi:hypothetical protein